MLGGNGSPVIGDADERIQPLVEQLVRQGRPLGGAGRGMGQRPGQGACAAFALLRELRIQIAMSGKHPQRLGAEQDEADQKGCAKE
ncbi:hypothetical protein D3C81_2137370 [compost metagenome]